MSATVVFIGPELAATGYRLGGARTIVPVPGHETAALAQARRDGWLVLVCASVAARILPEAWQQAAMATTPLLVVVPDLQGQAPLPDLAERLRSQLGLVA
jgi:vacuolar-type H+-ATPase subunit F/Vma7